MKILINYADEKYRKTQRFNIWTGKRIAGFDKVIEYGSDDVPYGYKIAHKEIFDNSRGNGLWLWKPYLIQRTLRECSDGDVVFYADSGSFFLKKIDDVIASLNSEWNIWVSDIPLIENCFTKEECFLKMDCNSDQIRYSNQIQATFFMAKNNEHSRQFVDEWLHWCEDVTLLSPQGKLQADAPVGRNFLVHREDKSILSLLCKKKGIKPHRDPSQRGTWQNTYYSPNYEYCPTVHDDKYKNVILLHKSPDVNPIHILKMLIRTGLANFKMRG